MARRAQMRIGDAIEGLLGGLNSGTKLRESLAMAYWERAVGPQAAAASEPESVRDGVMFVRTKSAVWSQELKLMQMHILKDLNGRIGRPVIKDIIFRAQGVPPPAASKAPAPIPSETDLRRVEIPECENEYLQKQLSELDVIADPQIRHKVAARVTREMKLKHWRLAHGWRLCPRCESMHLGKSEICPICSIADR